MQSDFRVAQVVGIALRQRQDRTDFAEDTVGVFRRQNCHALRPPLAKLNVVGNRLLSTALPDYQPLRWASAQWVHSASAAGHLNSSAPSI